MSEKQTGKNRTRLLSDRDVHLAEAYFPYLIKQAINKQTITFGDLLDLSKQDHPYDKIVQNAIPVSTGRRLEVIRLIIEPLGLPDITSWVVNATFDNSEAYLEDFDPDKERQASAGIDWLKKFPDSILPTSEIRKKVVKRQTGISRKKAVNMLAEIPSENFQNIKVPKNKKRADFLGEFRQPIIQDVIDGMKPADAYWNALIDFKLDDM